MTPVCAKECILELLKHGINGDDEPYLGAIRFGCLHHLPVTEIVSGILLAHSMFHLVNMLPGNDELSISDKETAIKLLRAGKSLDEIFKSLRPSAIAKTKSLNNS